MSDDTSDATGRPASDPAREEPVIAHLAEVWGSVAAACTQVSPAQWDLPTACPGWTVKDQLSHLIGIERTLLGDPPPPELTEIPAHVTTPFGAVNEAWVEARRATPGDDLLAEFAETTTRRLTELRAMPPAAFDEVGWSPIGQVPYRQFMDVRVLDCWTHEQDIRQALGRPGDRNGAGEATSLRRCEETLPYLVGKRAAAPDGTIVRVAVHGELGRDIFVAVEGGRAARVSGPDGRTPTATVDIDQESFWRLCFGRTTPEEVIGAGAVRFDGDTELGRRLVGVMTFMT